jgi:hypothetical protein
VRTPVPLTIEQAVEDPAVKLCAPSEFEEGTVVTVTVSLLPYLTVAAALPVIVLAARFTVKMPVAYEVAVYESLFAILAPDGLIVYVPAAVIESVPLVALPAFDVPEYP